MFECVCDCRRLRELGLALCEPLGELPCGCCHLGSVTPLGVANRRLRFGGPVLRSSECLFEGLTTGSLLIESSLVPRLVFAALRGRHRHRGSMSILRVVEHRLRVCEALLRRREVPLERVSGLGGVRELRFALCEPL